MPIMNAVASLAVERLERSVPWYEKVFGRPADANPMPSLAEWKFERGGWLQVYELKERAGKGSVTLSITNLEQQIVELKRLGIDPGAPMESDIARVVMIKDPDGNSIAFAEAIDPRLAH
jgi:predicted enzyme related to lactoylglutathione lyase